MAWVRRAYERNPRLFALSEILTVVGIILIYMWCVPVWYWGIYRHDLVVPKGLSDLLYSMWLNRDVFQVVLIALLLVVVFGGNIVRRLTWKDIGVRVDNLWASAKECLVVLLLILCAAAGILLALPQEFAVEEYLGLGPAAIREDILEGLIAGYAQQFLLQGFFLIRFLQVFNKKPEAILASSAVFSALHLPNIRLVALTFIFGLVCCVLFLRNRNILTLGLLHGAVAQIVRFLFAAVVGFGVGYYDYNLRVGPRAGRPAYLAKLEYGAAPLKSDRSSGISIPVSVTNMSTTTWDTKNETRPVFMSYGLRNAEGEMISFYNSLTPLDKPISPGETAIVDVLVDVPPKPGDYLAEVDLVERVYFGPERVSIFFKWRGSKTVLVPFSVNQPD